MGVKPEGLKADFVSFMAEGGGDVAAGNGDRRGFWSDVIGADGYVGVSTMGAEVNEATGCRRNGATVQQPGGFHSR